MKHSVLGILVSAMAVLTSPALAADRADAGTAGQAVGTGQPDAGAAASSRKGYDSWKAHSDMGAAVPKSRAPAGVTHEYHRTTGACSDDGGGGADCDGRADHGGAGKAPDGGATGPTR